jgi:hypothetical protein
MTDIFTKQEGNLASPLIMSMLTIILVFAVSPIIAGGGISLAKYYADEQAHHALCDDDSDAQNVQIDGGVAHWTNPRSATCISSTASNWQSGVEYAQIPAAGPFTNQNNECSTQGNTPKCPWEYILPQEFTNLTDMPSTLKINASSTTLLTYTADTFIDVTVTINNTKVIDRSGQKFTQGTREPTTGQYYLRSVIALELTPVESRDWFDEAKDCEPNCNITLILENVEIGFSGTAKTSCLDRTSQCTLWRFELDTVDETTAEWAIQGTAIILGLFFSAVAVGSTSLWNPTIRFAQRKIQQTKGPQPQGSTIPIYYGGNQ